MEKLITPEEMIKRFQSLQSELAESAELIIKKPIKLSHTESQRLCYYMVLYGKVCYHTGVKNALELAAEKAKATIEKGMVVGDWNQKYYQDVAVVDKDSILSLVDDEQLKQ